MKPQNHTQAHAHYARAVLAACIVVGCLWACNTGPSAPGDAERATPPGPGSVRMAATDRPTPKPSPPPTMPPAASATAAPTRVSLRTALLTVSENNLREHLVSLGGPRNAAAQPEAVDNARRYIHAVLGALGYPVTEQLVDSPATPIEDRHVIATLAGDDASGERLIVLAHYDSIAASPGADDNASGVAVLLELARVLRPFSFSRTIVFAAVALEESSGVTGPMGSRSLALVARQENWPIVGVINLDMIAYAGQTATQTSPNGLATPFPSVGDFILAVANQESARLVESLAAAVRTNDLPLRVVPLVVPGRGESVPDSRRSDHAAFWDQGFPAIMLTDTANFRNPHYHRVTDTIETLNLTFAVQVARAVGALVGDLALIEE